VPEEEEEEEEEEEDDDDDDDDGDIIMTMESILTRNYFILQNLIGNFFIISRFIVYSLSEAYKIIMIA